MALTWNEIKDRALAFSREWTKAKSEDADTKPFWIEFFHVFGITSRRISSFEQKVKKLDGRDGYIDWLWKGNLLIEHKSLGKESALSSRTSSLLSWQLAAVVATANTRPLASTTVCCL